MRTQRHRSLREPGSKTQELLKAVGISYTALVTSTRVHFLLGILCELEIVVCPEKEFKANKLIKL